MKIQMEEEIYEGTPEEIAEAMRQNMFYPNEFASVEEYLTYMSETYERLTDIPARCRKVRPKSGRGR